jgi:RNA polymerase sigma factor (sigma-70 family)
MPPPAEGFATRFVLGPALRTQPDRRLVTLVREGYETAFEEIVRRYGKPLTRYAAAIVGSRSEDVTQDAFSKALLALRRDHAEIELRPWLFRIVRNTALNELRDHPPSPEVLAEAIAAGSNPAEELERREELADLMRRLRSLPEPQRAAIVMRELEGLSHEEIAAALGLSGGAARQAIYRARQALRNGLGLLLPLPLMRLLIDHGSEAAIAGVGGGATAAASGAGASIALKAGVVTVVLAGSVGTGIALQENRGHKDADATAAAATEQLAHQATTPLPSSPGEAIPSDDSGSGDDRGDDGESRHGGSGSNSGPGNADDDDGVVETGQSRASDDSGRGPSSKSGPGHGHGPGDSQDDRHGGRGGPGPGDVEDHSGHGPDGDSHSGRGSGEGRRSGGGGGGDDGGSSGPGSGERSGDDLIIEQPPPEEGAAEGTEDHSGSDSGSGSGSNSGSDSGDDGMP